MSQHLEKILAHALRQLTSEGSRRLRERLDLYKKFLKIEEHRLRLKHYSGAGGLEIVRDRASLLDVVLRHLFDGALEGSGFAERMPPVALLAIGGYGRGELNPYSDVDILFLHDSLRIADETEEVIEQVLYMLWDVGFKVGHSTRSIDGAIKAGEFGRDYQNFAFGIAVFSRQSAAALQVQKGFFRALRPRSGGELPEVATGKSR